MIRILQGTYISREDIHTRNLFRREGRERETLNLQKPTGGIGQGGIKYEVKKDREHQKNTKKPRKKKKKKGRDIEWERTMVQHKWNLSQGPQPIQKPIQTGLDGPIEGLVAAPAFPQMCILRLRPWRGSALLSVILFGYFFLGMSNMIPLLMLLGTRVQLP
jgi:hypothetical protein